MGERDPKIDPPPRSLGWDAVRQCLAERPILMLFGAFLPLLSIFQFLTVTFIFSELFGSDLSEVQRRGQEVPGEVVRIEEMRNRTINGEHPYQVDFRYHIAGVEREGSMQARSRNSDVAKWEVGKKVTVKTLGDQAMIAEIPIDKFPFPFPFPVTLIYLHQAIFFGVGCVCLHFGLRAAKQRYRLLKEGEVREGEILGVEGGPLAISISSFWSPFFGIFPYFGSHPPPILQPRWRVTYHHQDETGRELTGDSRTTDATLCREAKRGDRVRILVIPGEEQVSLILDVAVERVLADW